MPDLSSSDLVQRVRDLIYERPYETTSTTTDTGTTVAVVDGTRWEEGAIGEWQTGTVGGEQFYVRSVSVNNLTVQRGYAGTTAETHTSGDRVLKNPTYTYRQIKQSIEQTVLELWPYVYTAGTASITPAPSTTYWYDTNAALLGVISVTQLMSLTPEKVGRFGPRPILGASGRLYKIERNLPASLVTSTIGIAFPSGFYHDTNTVTLNYMKAVTGTTDIKDSGNLPVAECVVYGAVSRLLQLQEISRATWGEGAESNVSQGARLQAGSWYKEEYRNRLQTLGIRIKDFYQPDIIWK